MRKNFFLAAIFLFIIIPIGINAQCLKEPKMWQCRVVDFFRDWWSDLNPVEQCAIDDAYTTCLRYSRSPHTCRISECYLVNPVALANAFWICNSRDKGFNKWYAPGKHLFQAVGHALQMCLNTSPSPHTCRIIKCRQRF